MPTATHEDHPIARLRRARRLARELRTVRAMIGLHCRGRHGRRRGLCEECEALWAHVQERVGRCPLLADKPTCLACEIHCFRAERREQIRAVMRYAGPRMLWRHPWLALRHLLDGRRAPRSRRRRA